MSTTKDRISADLLRSLQNVALVDHDDDLLAPHSNLLHEEALGLGKWPIGRRHEKDEIAARDELRGHRFVLPDDGIGAGRIDDADLAEEFHGSLDGQLIGLTDRLLGRVSVLQQGDNRRRRRHTFCQQRLADKRVDERTLAGVELANDDEKKKLVELGDGLCERFLLLDARIDAGQRRSKPHQEDALFAQQRLLRRRQYACQHADRDAGIRPSQRNQRN